MRDGTSQMRGELTEWELLQQQAYAQVLRMEADKVGLVGIEKVTVELLKG